ncbi:m-AAA protease-interacting protein 1, mitochondrial isoform X2 [Bufo gargarizans]|uniref:m-AAA protease-interacting protein 1, mitochondrial isoform X2 n=1 Tax=Bufo gargarizans TaxID=30331 RepID=UPI001CF341BF|nr:m-AAA protease-interacting protein 1, mitochondrial isoform X2 [Bufo gargarizans]
MLRSVFRLSRFCVRSPRCTLSLVPLLRPPVIHQSSGLYCGTRGLSSQSPGPSRVVVVGVPNPIIWFRTRIYFFIIRTYLDRDFSVEEFTDGAKQAFSFVSRLLSQCKFEALENLVASEILKDLKEKCSVLTDTYRNALAAESDEIMYSFPGDVAIYYDDDDIPDEELEGTKLFQVVMGNENVKDQKRILTANYEFRREFTKGVKPDWIITRIEHSKLLE